jgi:hypothetical protein
MITAPEPHVVGAAVARLARLGGEATLGDLVGQQHGEAQLDHHQLRGALEWLEAAFIVECLGPDCWRLTPDLAETHAVRYTLGGRGSVERDLEIVAAWGEANVGPADAVRALSAAASDQRVPRDVSEAVSRLRGVTGETRRARYSLGVAFDVLESHNDGDYSIYERRKLTGERPSTLEEIAVERQISRERVRQMEQRFETYLDESVVENPDSPIRLAADALAGALGPAVRLSSVDDAVGELGPNAEALRSRPARLRLLLRLAGPYRSHGRWLVRDGFDAEADAAVRELIAANAYPRLEDVAAALVALGMRDRDVSDWLHDAAGLRVYEDRVISLGPTLADRGVAILAVRGEAMTLEDIFAELNEDRSIRSFKGQMQGDARVRRIGMKTYGLAAWGDEEYTSIVAEMELAIERAGGGLEVEELATELSRKFGVSEASVRMYAAAPPFYVDTAGRLAVGEDGRSGAHTKALALTRSCFQLPAGWAYRKVVDHDVLRGSGTPIPAGFAHELGLTVGETTQLTTPLGPLSCGWNGVTAYIGSLRKAAEELGAAEGDCLFVAATGGRSVSFSVVKAASRGATSGWERLAIECGLVGGSAEDVARAIGLDTNVATDARLAISARLHERGEEVLLAYLPPAVEESKPVDLLDALVKL